MASPQFVNKLQEEVVCPICIDILQDPVTIDYGHNFCFRCITQSGDASVLQCPLCKKSVRRDTVRPNWLLMNLVEKIQAMSPFEAQPEREELRCQKHQETIHYFCEHDGKFLCTVRCESKDRKLRKANLIEEAAQNYQAQVEHEKQRIRREFKHLRQVLKEEEKFLLLLLAWLGQEGEKGGHLFGTSTEVQLNSLTQPYLLRSQRFQFLHPTALPLDLEKKLSEAKSRNDSITETLKKFRASVTLDAASAHLVLSQDLKTVTLPFLPQGDSEEPADPQRFYGFRVLGLPGVSGVCQAWEAELGRVGAGPAAGRGLGLECQALLDGNTREELPVCPSRVGVRVDHERGEVVFYDAITSKHISSFPACFPGRVFPFFRLLFTGTQIALSP
ncbi:LOW QUALITY PROTEIN: E3 ubiquitin-protein ligase TRIM31 [Dugong dugon]